jgi:hypothetical protein
MNESVPLMGTALVRTHKYSLRANFTDPDGISVGTESALGHAVIVETVGIDVGCTK